MGYSDGHPVRLDGGRPVLDFLNTANWSESGEIINERLESLDDVRVWMTAIGLSNCGLPNFVEELRHFRSILRPAFTTQADTQEAICLLNSTIKAITGDVLSQSILDVEPPPEPVSLIESIALSAAAILSDQREKSRLRHCPGKRCGWVFLDETKNARRKWCSMQTCGNREKAKRNYERSKNMSA
jgi:predicted RNA-binding Zn ribbon-like protein